MNNKAKRLEIEFNEQTGKFVLPSWVKSYNNENKYAVCNFETGEISTFSELRVSKIPLRGYAWNLTAIEDIQFIAENQIAIDYMKKQYERMLNYFQNRSKGQL